MRRTELISSFLFFAFGLIAILIVIPIAVVQDSNDSYGLAARDMPYFTASLITLLAGIHFFAVLRQKPPEETEEASPLLAADFVFLAIALVLFVSVIVLFSLFGFLAGAPVLVGTCMVLMGERRATRIIPTALIAPLVLWLFFWKLLEFPLP